MCIHYPLTFIFRGAPQCNVNEGFPKPDTECKLELGDIGFRYEILWTRQEETLETERENNIKIKILQSSNINKCFKTFIALYTLLMLWHEISCKIIKYH